MHPEQPTSPVMTLNQSLAGILEHAEGLRADVHAAEAARIRANRINVALLVLLAVLVAVVAGVGWQNNRLARDVKTGNARIVDCTSAGGTCYGEGQERTTAAVAAITRISVYVSQCGRLYPGESGPAYDRKLEACVAEKLATDAKRTPGN